MREKIHREHVGGAGVHAIIDAMKPRDADALPPFPAEAASLLLPGPAGAIELACAPPSGQRRDGVAIICHPHPLQGGTMFNKVVTTLERALGEIGLATVRFNFRGVGRSEGVHDEGRGESEDLAAVAAWVRREKPDAALWLAGFSFGSYVVLRAAPSLAPSQVILIAPPVDRCDFSTIEWPTCPVLIVQGDEDDVVDPEAVREWASRQEPPPTFVRMPETGHFFHRRLIDLRGAVRNAVRDNLPPLAS
jgi:alpha/beta superfamily hydrolase